MTSARTKRGKEQGGTKIWLILLMVVHGFVGRVSFLTVAHIHIYVSKSFSFRDRQKFINLFGILVLHCFLEAQRGTKAYHESRLD